MTWNAPTQSWDTPAAPPPRRHRGLRNTIVVVLALIVLFVVATFGAIQLMHSGSNTAIDPAQQVSPGSDVPTPVEYFPAQYVNQATQPEKHIESF